METIKFNGSHEGAQIRSQQKQLTLEEQEQAVSYINALMDDVCRSSPGETLMLGLTKSIQALIDDYQNACHARSYSGVKD